MTNHPTGAPASNYTQSPNILFDYWLPRLSHAEFKLLMYISRQTFGWHTLGFEMSYTDLANQTGISKNGLIAGLKTLLDLKIIVKTMKKNDKGIHEKNGYVIHVLVPAIGTEELGGLCDESTTSSAAKVPSHSAAKVPSPVGSPYKERKVFKENKKERSSSDTQKRSKPPLDFFYSHQTFSFEGITEQDLNDWKTIYPCIDVNVEIKKITQWLRGNPNKSHKTLWRKFVTTWLQKNNEEASNKQAYRDHQKKNDLPNNIPVSEQAKINIQLMRDTFKDFPQLLEITTEFGSKSVKTSKPKNGCEGTVNFDLNPEIFKRIFYKMLGVIDD